MHRGVLLARRALTRPLALDRTCSSGLFQTFSTCRWSAFSVSQSRALGAAQRVFVECPPRSLAVCRPPTVGDAGVSAASQLSAARSPAAAAAVNSLSLAGRVRHALFTRCMRCVAMIERLLQRQFPTAVQMYRVFSTGIKALLSDLKQLTIISWHVHRRGLHGLSLYQLQLYYQTPRDILAVTPLLLVSALPLAQNVAYPVAYMFPRRLLSRHFWSESQRAQFALLAHRKRLIHYRPLLRCLHSRVSEIEDTEMRQFCVSLLDQLFSGFQPGATDIVRLARLFDSAPFGLDHLTSKHTLCLLRVLGLGGRMSVCRGMKLHQHAVLLQHMDAAILEEQLTDMSFDQLRYACYLRGLCGEQLSREHMVAWLVKWSEVSDSLPSSTSSSSPLSLLLHCPVLLGINHPNNWRCMTRAL